MTSNRIEHRKPILSPESQGPNVEQRQLLDWQIKGQLGVVSPFDLQRGVCKRQGFALDNETRDIADRAVGRFVEFFGACPEFSPADLRFEDGIGFDVPVPIGVMAMTRKPNSANSRAKGRVMAATAPLDAA